MRPPTEADRTRTAGRVGLFETRGILPRAPRLGIDVLVTNHVSVGMSEGIGWTRATFRPTLVPTSGSTAVAWAVSPRVGVLASTSKHGLVWPRLGVTYAESHGSRSDVGDVSASQVSVDLEVFGGYRLSSRLFFAVGPSISMPLVGRADRYTPKGSQRVDYAVQSFALTGMLGLTL